MNHLLNARFLFGLTMAVHIIFAVLGVGIPLMMLIAEITFQKTKDRDYAIMTKRWTKTFTILLGVGIPTGTIASVQLSVLWPSFMEAVGKVISLPFQIEIYAFFLESIFMTIYVYAADRISNPLRILSLTLVTIGAILSAILITNVHAWQETPSGFDYVNGEFLNVNPWKAFFNPIFLTTASHVVTSAFMVGSFMIVTVAAYKMLRKGVNEREYKFHQKALMIALAVGGLSGVATALNGHDSAMKLHIFQPEKLAAAEGLFETTANAPLAVGGIVDPNTQQVKWALQVPSLLSILATGKPSGIVRGLNEFPRDEWPPLVTHILFDSMVGVGTLLILLAVLGFWFKRINKDRRFPKWLLWGFVLSGPLSIAGIELGWSFSEIGRQPWTIYRVLRTSEAVTTNGNMGLFFLIFVGLYVLLGVITLLVLRYYFKRHPLSKDLEKIN
ncbi:cytochrome ubiquinol oxidase subunit I [Tepidibacillus fermentans]|uniref:Cytochrome bd-I ubiquinol oxidase subunit 1 apoprotein n=1 Tax=Tepidibacillus fermentans TaxID=1281767 RepID=A0A4R3KCV1_9BACI|nr:cytochrome ubiquinol oxidase subunit I [Tepidibacillus fermentans]TCS81074.1 cytochrome bd-I ubiquinol oxidase subunit 1 apoprotein [Tepidibacillus fermentans]